MLERAKETLLFDTKKVLLVDDHPVLRMGLAQLIDTDPNLTVSGEASSYDEALVKVEESGPDLVVLDVSLGGASGIELVKEIRRKREELPLLVVSMHDEMVFAERALRAGANGYLMKKTPPADLLDGMHRALRREVVVSERVSGAVLSKLFRPGQPAEEPAVAALSDRELEIFERIGHGHQTREIAELLKISVKTVDTHKAHIKKKLQLKRSTDLLRSAMTWVAETTTETEGV